MSQSNEHKHYFGTRSCVRVCLISSFKDVAATLNMRIYLTRSSLSRPLYIIYWELKQTFQCLAVFSAVLCDNVLLLKPCQSIQTLNLNSIHEAQNRQFL